MRAPRPARLLLAIGCLAAATTCGAADFARLRTDLASSDGQAVLRALRELKGLGPAGAPAAPDVVALLKAKKSYPYQDYGLDNVVYPEAFETLRAVGVRSDGVLAVSLDYFETAPEHLNVKPLALDLVAGYGQKAAPVVPRLTEELSQGRQARDRARLIDALERIGPPAASAAVPGLLAVAAEPGGDRVRAFSALNRLAPTDRRVLRAYADVVWTRPRNSEDAKVYDLFAQYLSGCGALARADLETIAGALEKYVRRESAETRSPGHVVGVNPAFLSGARLFLSHPESADLVMPALAERIRQLDMGMKEFPQLLDLAGEFGAAAAPLVPAIYERASSRERVMYGFLKPSAIETLQRIGTPAASQKARALASLRP